MFAFIRKHWKYAGYVVRHKWFVFLECLRYGLLWRGIVHDWSKLLPDEWIPYANYFAPGNVTRRPDGTLVEDPAFDVAWNKHQKRQPHHWQYWVLHRDNGDVQPLDMPMRYRKEMLADWRGAGRAQGKPDTLGWYLANRHRMMLNVFTRSWVEAELGVVRPETLYSRVPVDY